MYRRSTSLLKRPMENWRAMTKSSVPVVRNARQVLIQLYRKTLQDIKEVPVTAGYRQNVEAITKWRLSVCEATHSHKQIEMAIEAGFVEDIIEQAKMELELMPFMLNRRPWEVPLDWEPPKLNIDGFEFDWVKLRQERIEKSFKIRSEMSEEERKELMEQLMNNSNPDIEIYPKEMADYKKNGAFLDLKSYKGVRFGA